MNALTEQNNELVSVSKPRVPAQSASANALMQRTLAEVQVAVMMAKQFPRDKIASREVLQNDCSRLELAQVAMYSYNRGGTDITGPSIHLAQAAKKAWGNMQSGWRELSRTTGPDGVGVSEIEAFAWDAESNTRESVVFSVRHWRDTKKGGYPIKEERDIYELCANQASRRERACILKTIDGDIVDAAVKQCQVTLTTNVQVTPERIANLVKSFQDQYGVSQSQIEKRIQRRVEAMLPAHIISLTNIHNSLKDGMSVASDWFEAEEASEKEVEEAKSKSGNEKAKGKLSKVDKAKAEGANPETGELPDKKPEQKAEAMPEPKKEEATDDGFPGDNPSTQATLETYPFSTRQIPMKGQKENATQPDADAWKVEFMQQCNASPSLEKIGKLFANNANLMNQLKTRAPLIYAECQRCYEENCERLKETEGQE